MVMVTNIPTVRRVAALTEKLDDLLAEDSEGPHVSIYQAAGRQPDEANKARVQLRSHVTAVRRQLTRSGESDSDVEALLAPLVKLDGDDGFWNHQQGGLAIFAGQGTVEVIPVAHAFENMALVTRRFHLKPLMGLAANADAYHLLCLSQKEVKLLRGSALGIREIELDDLPESYEAAMDALGFPSDSFAASAAGSNLKVDHEHLKKFFREIDAPISAYLLGTDWPLLLAGVDYYESLYREKNNYPHLSDAYIAGNPEHRDLEEMHEEATKLLKSEFIESQKRALIRLAKIEKPENVITELADVIESAQEGRIDTLIVPYDAQKWGNYDLKDRSLETMDEPNGRNVDLYETAARLALQNGAEVFFIKANQIPNRAELMANLRW
ncbi:MAG: hypothetical protein ACI9R3_005033 [Verrucomicrobiales bacterium]|jgi:hypothetical protein